MDVKQIKDKVNLCEEAIGKAIIGQKEVVKQVLAAILVDGNVLLEGVPGLGKTQLVKALSGVLDVGFSRIQFTPDLMPADVTGTNLIVKERDKSTFRFEKGPVFTNLLLADEINRATPKTQSALLEAMQEKTVTVGNHTYALPAPFMVLATQNPIESEGTYPLPEAQLDRFLLKCNVPFPSMGEMREIMDLTITNTGVELAPVLSGSEILSMRSAVREIPMTKDVKDYALSLVMGTHPELPEGTKAAKAYLSHGAGPRAAQALFLTSKAIALMDGRFNVAFQDVEEMARPVLRHRIVLNFEAISEGLQADDVIGESMKEGKR